MDLSILIPAKNCSALTACCLDAVERTLPRGLDAEILVYDDASTDDTPSVLAARKGRVGVIRGENPGWFARNMNELSRAARGRWLVHLNNDTVPLDGWIEPLLRCVADRPDAAVVGNLHLYPAPAGRTRAINHAGVVFGEDRIGRHLYQGLGEDLAPARKDRRLQAVSAACWLTPADVFHDLGGYDEAFRNGHEDIDFCLRAGGAGLDVWYTGASAIIHYGSSTPGRFAHDDENQRLFLERWADTVTPDQSAIAAGDGVRWPDYPAPYRIARNLSKRPAVRQVLGVAVRTPVGARLRQGFVTRFSSH